MSPQWLGSNPSLTVARQRGIFTRFPVPIRRHAQNVFRVLNDAVQFRYFELILFDAGENYLS
jgi:hypothetical protein